MPYPTSPRTGNRSSRERCPETVMVGASIPRLLERQKNGSHGGTLLKKALERVLELELERQ